MQYIYYSGKGRFLADINSNDGFCSSVIAAMFFPYCFVIHISILTDFLFFDLWIYLFFNFDCDKKTEWSCYGPTTPTMDKGKRHGESKYTDQNVRVFFS